MARKCKTPLVSVVIPAWNAEPTLRETLDSVARQTYRNLEILIVDDGSTDRTAQVAADFCADEPRARLIRNQNGGVASARNAGIEQASGKWIAPIDADDLWHPAKIEKQVAAALAASEPPGFVYCWSRVIDDEGTVIGSGPQWTFNGRAFEQIAYRNPVQNGSSLLMSAAAARAVGGYDSTLRDSASQGCEDVMIQLRIARQYPVAAVPEFLVGYRVRADSMSGDDAQMLRSWRMVYDRINSEAPLPRTLMRWYEADISRTLADQSALKGRYLRALRHFVRAVWLDPVRWTPYLAYRAARAALRLLRERRRRPGIAFDQADPRAPIAPDPNDVEALAALLRRIDSRRLQRLAR